MVGASAEHLFVNGNHHLDVTDLDGALLYDQLDLVLGSGGSSSPLTLSGGGRLTVARGLWGLATP